MRVIVRLHNLRDAIIFEEEASVEPVGLLEETIRKHPAATRATIEMFIEKEETALPEIADSGIEHEQPAPAPDGYTRG